MEQSENIGDLALALSKAQGMLEGASKTSDNQFFKSKYADLHECLEAAKVALSKNDLAVIQTTNTDELGNIWIYTTLAHKSGQWVRGRLRMKPKKDDDQATGSSLTYGRRYCFAAIVGLAQKDDDGNESFTEPKEPQKPLDAEFFQNKLDAELKKSAGKESGVISTFITRHKKPLDMLPANEMKAFEAHIAYMLKEFPAPPEYSDFLKKIISGCNAYKDIDTFTVAWENKIKPHLSDLSSDEQKIAEQSRLATVAKLTGGTTK